MRATYRLPTLRATRRRVPMAVLAAAVVSSGGCARSSGEPPPPDFLALGTWGADGSAVIVGDREVHVHLGCTKGDFLRPESLVDGRFNVEGTYILRAYPIQLGPALPARFTGVVRGSLLTLAVAVNDTVEKKLVALGPVTIVLGREPRMGPCPICAAKPASPTTSSSVETTDPDSRNARTERSIDWSTYGWPVRSSRRLQPAW